MNVLKKRRTKCALCQNHDEEDLLLLTRAITRTATGINLWGREGTPFLSDVESTLREISKLTNFRKFITDMFVLKYPDIENCQHKQLSQYFILIQSTRTLYCQI